MFKNIIFYRLSGLDIDVDKLDELLSIRAFTECSKAALESKGWLNIASQSRVCEAGGHLLISLGIDKKSLPGKLVKAKVAKEMEAYKRRHGELPKGRAKREITDEIKTGLTAKLFAIRSDLEIMIDGDRQWLAVNTSSAAQAEKAMKFLRESLPDIDYKLKTMDSNDSVSFVLTDWVREKAPKDFNVTGDATLKDEDGQITLKNQALSSDDIQTHLDNMPVVKLGMSSESVSLTINDKLILSGLSFSPELLEEYEGEDAEDEQGKAAYLESVIILFRKEFNVLFNMMVKEFNCVALEPK